MMMKPQTVAQMRTMAVDQTMTETAAQADSSNQTVLNTIVLLVGLLVLIISIKIMSGF